MTEKQPSDHDLLLRIDERTRAIKDDISELKTTTYGKNGLKERVQRIENVWSVCYGIGLVISFLVGIYAAIIKK